ncbi:MAG TPA: alpha/beta fold hydrolase [Solirubrobacterales bacterium]|nr:alpha/beta fold hydrolase [Solirubrobacterales bacterium]
MSGRARRGVIAAIAVGAASAIGASAAPASDHVVHSFDGTPIVASWFPAPGLKHGQRAPTVLVGHGWGGSRYDRTASFSGAGESLGPKQLLRAGYNVLTWDARGFGQSGGTVHVDSPHFEARDVEKLVTFVAHRRQALLDGPGDPRVGMAGGSYGGGIQLNTASMDPRIDALVPGISWHSLLTSLLKHGAVKGGWGSLLFGLGVPTSFAPLLGPAGLQSGTLDPHVTSAFLNGVVFASPSDSDRRFFRTRGPGHRVAKIRVPTLLIQGTADTLFTLHEADRNYRILHRHHVPVKMIWFCGGHGQCMAPSNAPLSPPAAQERYTHRAALHWFNRYLKGRRSVGTGKRFRWFADDGKLRSSSRYPLRKVGAVRARGSGSLALSNGETSGLPYAGEPAPPGAVNVQLGPLRRGGNLVGMPKLRLRYSGQAEPASTFVYAQLVDLSRNVVVGSQVMPVPLTLDGASRTIRLSLETIAARAHKGSSYELQLVSGSEVYEPQRSTGTVTFSRISIALPRTKPAASR